MKMKVIFFYFDLDHVGRHPCHVLAEEVGLNLNLFFFLLHYHYQRRHHHRENKNSLSIFLYCPYPCLCPCLYLYPCGRPYLCRCRTSIWQIFGYCAWSATVTAVKSGEKALPSY